MKYLLDTDTCVYLFTNRYPTLTERVRDCDQGSLALSVITFAELSWGSANGKLPTPEVLDAFAADVELLMFDEAASRAYATLPFRRGRFDRLIAAHALSLDLILVTNNERDFSAIPGLKFENWTR